MVLNNIKACLFDAYGTLFDVHSAIDRHRVRIGRDAERVSALWRTKQLEYTWLRSLMGAYANFWQVTGEALDYALDTFGLHDAALREDLMRAYLNLDCYPEVKDTLAALKQNNMRIAVLSNGTRSMIGPATKAAGIEDLIDGIYTVDDVGVYKPHPKVYQLACERLHLPPDRISFHSANAWDAAGAAHFGLKAVWINRLSHTPERLPKGPAADLPDLSDLPALLAS